MYQFKRGDRVRPSDLFYKVFRVIHGLSGIAIEECHWPDCRNPNKLYVKVEWEHEDFSIGYWDHIYLTRVES